MTSLPHQCRADQNRLRPKALIFCYNDAELDEPVKDEDAQQQTATTPAGLWFANQVASDACASIALLNIGKAQAPVGEEPLQITLDGADAAKLFREIGADILVPMHYESWTHFSESKTAFVAELEKAGISDKVLWLEPGAKTTIV